MRSSLALYMQFYDIDIDGPPQMHIQWVQVKKKNVLYPDVSLFALMVLLILRQHFALRCTFTEELLEIE